MPPTINVLKYNLVLVLLTDVSSLKALTPAQPTLTQTHFPMMLPVCYSLKSIGLDTDTNTFSNVATSLLNF